MIDSLQTKLFRLWVVPVSVLIGPFVFRSQSMTSHFGPFSIRSHLMISHLDPFSARSFLTDSHFGPII